MPARYQVVPLPVTNAAEDSAGEDEHLPPRAITPQAQMCLWLVYISQGTAFVFPFSSFPTKKNPQNLKSKVEVLITSWVRERSERRQAKEMQRKRCWAKDL